MLIESMICPRSRGFQPFPSPRKRFYRSPCLVYSRTDVRTCGVLIEQTKRNLVALAETYASLSDDEVVQQVLANHKPSANPVVRIVWIVFAAFSWCSLPSVSFFQVGPRPHGWWPLRTVMAGLLRTFSDGWSPTVSLARCC